MGFALIRGVFPFQQSSLFTVCRFHRLRLPPALPRPTLGEFHLVRLSATTYKHEHPALSRVFVSDRPLIYPFSSPQVKRNSQKLKLCRVLPKLGFTIRI